MSFIEKTPNYMSVKLNFESARKIESAFSINLPVIVPQKLHTVHWTSFIEHCARKCGENYLYFTNVLS